MAIVQFQQYDGALVVFQRVPGITYIHDIARKRCFRVNVYICAFYSHLKYSIKYLLLNVLLYSTPPLSTGGGGNRQPGVGVVRDRCPDHQFTFGNGARER